MTKNKGGLDNSLLSSLGLSGVLTGKKFATGSGVATGGSLTVTGLNFTPKIIFVKSTTTWNTSCYCNYIGWRGATNTFDSGLGTPSFSWDGSFDGVTRYALNGTFKILAPAGENCNWIAIE